MSKKISLVSTIFNDVNGLKAFLDWLEGATRKPDEVVITDAGSRDGTWELLQQMQAAPPVPEITFISLQEARCNVARGRNLSIKAARGDLIVSTDIGCAWEPEWLEELVEPFDDNPDLELVNGSWAVKEEGITSPWALTEWALKGDQKLVGTATSFSSSRSIAYRKPVWAGLGGYPEELTLAADDAVFALLVKKAGIRRVGAPVVRCYWHRHSRLKAFLKEMGRYGLGDGEAGIRGRDVLLIGGRLAIEAVCLVAGLLCLLPFMPVPALAGIILLLVSALSVGERLRKLPPAVARLRAKGVSWPWGRLLLFTYATKWFWLKGYAKGFLSGFRRCTRCRRLLKEMSPATYAARSKAPST